MSKCKTCNVELTEKNKCDCGCNSCLEHCSDKDKEDECCHCNEKDCCK